MIIDDVVWNVIAHKHCAFRMKYIILLSIKFIEHNPKIFAKTNTI
jgi:hypothetical protein